MNEKIPLLVVAGPTASGKTSLGVALSKALGGEVISADSMQIYKGMDIATAKPTAEEMEGIPHHLIDFQPADEPFSLADYLILAEKKVKYTLQRSKGLGENDPDMMALTTMDPATRRLIRVTPADAAATAVMFETLLGDDLPARKRFIAANSSLYMDEADI